MRPNKLFCVSLLIAVYALAEGAHGQDANPSNQAPVCLDATLPVIGLPATDGISFDLTAADLLKQCQTQDGGQLTLVEPSEPMHFNPQPNSTDSRSFTVQDDQGRTTSAKVTVTRD